MNARHPVPLSAVADPFVQPCNASTVDTRGFRAVGGTTGTAQLRIDAGAVSDEAVAFIEVTNVETGDAETTELSHGALTEVTLPDFVNTSRQPTAVFRIALLTDLGAVRAEAQWRLDAPFNKRDARTDHVFFHPPRQP